MGRGESLALWNEALEPDDPWLGTHGLAEDSAIDIHCSQTLSVTSLLQRPTCRTLLLLECGHTYSRRPPLTRHVYSKNSTADALGCKDPGAGLIQGGCPGGP